MPTVSVMLVFIFAGIIVGILCAASLWPRMRGTVFLVTFILLGAFLVWAFPLGASNPWAGPLFLASCFIAYAFGSAALMSHHPAMRDLSLLQRAALVLTQSRILRPPRGGQ